jgi:hypothetical protein
LEHLGGPAAVEGTELVPCLVRALGDVVVGDLDQVPAELLEVPAPVAVGLVGVLAGVKGEAVALEPPPDRRPAQVEVRQELAVAHLMLEHGLGQADRADETQGLALEAALGEPPGTHPLLEHQPEQARPRASLPAELAEAPAHGLEHVGPAPAGVIERLAHLERMDDRRQVEQGAGHRRARDPVDLGEVDRAEPAGLVHDPTVAPLAPAALGRQHLDVTGLEPVEPPQGGSSAVRRPAGSGCGGRCYPAVP